VVTRKKISNRNEMSAIELALICGTFCVSPSHYDKRSGDEEIASVDNSVSHLSPEAFVICTLVTDDINFLRAAKEPAHACQYNESAYHTKRHIRFATVGLPVVGKIYAYYSQSDQNYEPEEDVVPNEECIGEARNIQEITGYLQTTVGASQEEQRDERDAQRQKRP